MQIFCKWSLKNKVDEQQLQLRGLNQKIKKRLTAIRIRDSVLIKPQTNIYAK